MCLKHETENASLCIFRLAEAEEAGGQSEWALQGNGCNPNPFYSTGTIELTVSSENLQYVYSCCIPERTLQIFIVLTMVDREMERVI